MPDTLTADLPTYKRLTSGFTRSLPGDFETRFQSLAAAFDALPRDERDPVRKKLNALTKELYESPLLLPKGFRFRLHHREKKRRAVGEIIRPEMTWNVWDRGEADMRHSFNLYYVIETTLPGDEPEREAVLADFLKLVTAAPPNLTTPV